MGSTNSYIGKTIGNYRVTSELGSGSFGVVYRGEHVFLPNRIGAVKLMHAAHLDSWQDRESFLLEARLLEMLKHPHIIPILDVGIQDGFPYMVTEFAPLGSLRDRLQQIAPRLLSMAESTKMLAQIGEALDHAHQQNIIHRDLKPANILFNSTGDALLADFGIATTLATASIKFVDASGSPPYMAPEQFQGTVSKESDQYSLGCIAYELFTGQRPFSAPDPFTIGFKHLTEAPVPPTRLNPRIPPQIEQAILKVMSKDRTARYPTVAAFIAALQTAPLPHAAPGAAYASTTGELTLPFPTSAGPSSATYLMDEDTAKNLKPIQFTPAASASALLASQELLTQAPTIAQPAQPALTPAQQEMPTVPTHPLPVPASATSNTQLLEEEEELPTLRSQKNPATPVPDPITPLPGIAAAALWQETIVTPLSPAAREPSVKLPTVVAAASGPFFPPGALQKPAAPDKSNRRRRLLAVALVALALLLVAGGVIYAFSGTNTGIGRAIKSTTSAIAPGSAPLVTTAAVTLTPDSKNVTHAYTIDIVSGQPNPSRNQASGAAFFPSSATEQQTVQSTGKGTKPATTASGILTFSKSKINQDVPAGVTIKGNSGVVIVLTQTVVLHSGNVVQVTAQAQSSGAQGNIPANDINGTYYYNYPQFTFHVQNFIAFTGGANAQTYTYLQQSDIANGVSHLTGSTTSSAQASLNAKLAAYGQLIGRINCSTSSSSDNKAYDHVSSTTVHVTVNCTAEAYNTQAAQALAIQLFKHNVTSLFGAGYALEGNVKPSLGSASLVDGQGTVAVVITTAGFGVYQFTNAQKLMLARLIAGKTSTDALSLLKAQTGVSQDKIILANGASKLPTNAGNIVITILNVKPPAS